MSKATLQGSTAFACDRSGAWPLLLREDATSYVYGEGGHPLEQISGTTVLSFHQDQLGSTRLLTDSAGNTAASYTYDAYGNLVSQTGAAATSLQFTGEYRDGETGLYYLRARHYDPATAQFLSRDPEVMKTRSPYGYVDGNPLNHIDPSGETGCGRGAPCDPYHGHEPDYGNLPTCHITHKGQVPSGPCQSPPDAALASLLGAGACALDLANAALEAPVEFVLNHFLEIAQAINDCAKGAGIALGLTLILLSLPIIGELSEGGIAVGGCLADAGIGYGTGVHPR